MQGSDCWMMKSNMHWLDAGAIAAAYKSRALTPSVVMAHLLERIAALDTRYHAFISIDAEAAMQAAHQAERELAAGAARGPLHGIPYAVKDIIDIRGQITTCHSRIRMDGLARSDATVIARLKRAGAISMGKLALHEFAIGGPSFDLPFPPSRNPWNTDHHPGGSSSGSGAALAAGFLPLALGTDTAGSIRNPAAACGIVGLKPTYELIPRDGVFPFSDTLDHVGPMARSIRDLALLMDAIATPDGACGAYGTELDRGFDGLRIGYVKHFHCSDMPADTEVAEALDQAAEVMRRAGAQVDEIRLASLKEFDHPLRIIFQKESWDIHARWLRERPQDYGENARTKLMMGADISEEDYRLALEQRLALRACVDQAFGQADVLLTACSMDPPCKIDDTAAIARTFPRQARSPFNLTGHPALSMMSGLSRAGLPLSLQLVGRANDERTLLRAGAAYEQATHWRDIHPPI